MTAIVSVSANDLADLRIAQEQVDNALDSVRADLLTQGIDNLSEDLSVAEAA